MNLHDLGQPPPCGCAVGCFLGNCVSCTTGLAYVHGLEGGGVAAAHLCDPGGRSHVHTRPFEACCGTSSPYGPEGSLRESQHGCPNCAHPLPVRTRIDEVVDQVMVRQAETMERTQRNTFDLQRFGEFLVEPAPQPVRRTLVTQRLDERTLGRNPEHVRVFEANGRLYQQYVETVRLEPVRGTE